MASPKLIATDTMGVEIATVSFPDAERGVGSTPVAFRLKNDDSAGAVDPAPVPAIVAKQLNQSGQAVSGGLRAIDERWLQVRALGTGSAGSEQQATDWVAIGSGRWFFAARLESGEYHDFEARLFPPSNAPVGQVDLTFEFLWGRNSLSVDLGLSETHRDGVFLGIGRDDFDQFLVGGDVTEAAVPDDTVEVDDEIWIDDGEVRSELASSPQLDQNDGAAAALGAGEGYIALITYKEAMTVTKGLKDALGAPPQPPALPSGHRLKATVLVDDSGTIGNADITQNEGVKGMGWTSSNLTFTVLPGWMFINNYVAPFGTASDLTLPPNDVSWVWVRPDATMETNVTGVAPLTGAYLIYRVTTDGSGVTLVEDFRDLLGAEHVEVRFAFPGTLAAGSVYVFPGRKRNLYINPLAPLQFSIGEPGGGTVAHTQGRAQVGAFKGDGAGGWTALFTSFATDDRRPVADWDDANPVSHGIGGARVIPEVAVIEPGLPLKFTLSLPTAFDGTPAPAEISGVLPLLMA